MNLVIWNGVLAIVTDRMNEGDELIDKFLTIGEAREFAADYNEDRN